MYAARTSSPVHPLQLELASAGPRRSSESEAAVASVPVSAAAAACESQTTQQPFKLSLRPRQCEHSYTKKL
eukprot:1668945-Rhodomonas_salina.2